MPAVRNKEIYLTINLDSGARHDLLQRFCATASATAPAPLGSQLALAPGFETGR
jgi:hypothetical protein